TSLFPMLASASKRIAAVTPEPQVVITGRSTSTPACAMRVLTSSFGLISPDWTTARQGRLRLPGIWPERNPGRGSAAMPLNRATACPLHLFGTGNGGAIEIHGEGPGHAPHEPLFERAPFGPPSWQTAGKDFH